MINSDVKASEAITSIKHALSINEGVLELARKAARKAGRGDRFLFAVTELAKRNSDS
jgi:hypothetical protein